MFSPPRSNNATPSYFLPKSYIVLSLFSCQLSCHIDRHLSDHLNDSKILLVIFTIYVVPNSVELEVKSRVSLRPATHIYTCWSWCTSPRCCSYVTCEMRSRSAEKSSAFHSYPGTAWTSTSSRRRDPDGCQQEVSRYRARWETSSYIQEKEFLKMKRKTKRKIFNVGCKKRKTL